MLAAGARIRGRWRYVVRSTRDPFARMTRLEQGGDEKRPCERASAD